MKKYLERLIVNNASLPIRVVFICTANCCRSPLAEILFEKLLIDELGSRQRIREKNLIIESAGTSYSGLKIATQSAELLFYEENVHKNRCREHRGRHLEEIKDPGLILTMTRSHKFQVINFQPAWKEKTFTLDGFVKKDLGIEGKDIEDPMIGPKQDYKRMKNQVKNCLYLLLAEFKDAGLI